MSGLCGMVRTECILLHIEGKKCDILLSRHRRSKYVSWNMGEPPPLDVREQSQGNKRLYPNSDKVLHDAPVENEITAEKNSV